MKTYENFKAFKKANPNNRYARTLKGDEEFKSAVAEFTELTRGGDYECAYELAQMEGVDVDDIMELIGRY